MLPPKRQNLFPPFATTFDGDPAECSKQLGRARGMLSLMCRSVPPVKSRTETMADGVELRVTTNPNHVYIKAGGQVYITYPDWKGLYSPPAYFIHKSSVLITEEPPPSIPPNRAMPLPRFNPIFSTTVKSGSDWWVSNNKMQCVSWNLYWYYINGVEYPSHVGIIYSMCISKHGNVFVYLVSPSNELWIRVVNNLGVIILDRSFHTLDYGGGYISKFLKDTVTFIWLDNIKITRVIFSSDYSTSTIESISLPLYDIPVGSGVVNKNDYICYSIEKNFMSTSVPTDEYWGADESISLDLYKMIISKKGVNFENIGHSTIHKITKNNHPPPFSTLIVNTYETHQFSMLFGDFNNTIIHSSHFSIDNLTHSVSQNSSSVTFNDAEIRSKSSDNFTYFAGTKEAYSNTDTMAVICFWDIDGDGDPIPNSNLAGDMCNYPVTLIINLKTRAMQWLEYRVDKQPYSTGSFYQYDHPLSVTHIPK